MLKTSWKNPLGSFRFVIVLEMLAPGADLLYAGLFSLFGQRLVNEGSIDSITRRGLGLQLLVPYSWYLGGVSVEVNHS